MQNLTLCLRLPYKKRIKGEAAHYLLWDCKGWRMGEKRVRR